MTDPNPGVLALASRIQLLLMDVDGVLTNGRLYNVPNAEGKMVETKGFDSQDGIGLQWLSWKGIKTGVISGRLSPATEERARQCKMAYIGDDFTDIVIMRRVGLAVATANAREEVRRAAHYVTKAAGGEGAVREMVELLLKAQGKWQEILEHYEVG